MINKPKLICVLVVTFLGIEITAQNRFEFQYQQMGTQIRLVFYASDQVQADSVSKTVFSRIDDLNTKLSDYLPESELNVLCKKVQQDVLVSQDLFLILKESVEISKLTDGAFDITAGPLIELWRNARKTKRIPIKTEIQSAKGKMGYQFLFLPNEHTVRLKRKGMKLDLGGIGKGFAADVCLDLLESYGITSALIDMGGDIRVGSPPPVKEYWTLAFSYFNEKGEEIVKKVRLKNQAIATSGDLYQFVNIDGIKYSHIVDPKSGRALNNGIQVTTIAQNATLADGYASAISVLGIKKTKRQIKDFPVLEVFVVEHAGDTYGQWNSSGLEKFLVENGR